MTVNIACSQVCCLASTVKSNCGKELYKSDAFPGTISWERKHYKQATMYNNYYFNYTNNLCKYLNNDLKQLTGIQK